MTGRTEHAAVTIATAAGLGAPVIACNGAFVTDPRSGTRLTVSTFDPAAIPAIRGEADRTGLQFIAWTANEMRAEERTAFTELLEEVNDEPVVIGPIEDEPRGIVKVMLAGDDALLDDHGASITERHPFIRRSMGTFLEGSSPGASKVEALRFVLERLGISPEVTIGFGDGETDVEWMSAIGYPIAMGNARSGVVRIARERVGHHRDDAVAAYLEELLRGEESAAGGVE
ncbi:HAD hydrolase family protein [Microbacterium sp. J1-1]|uniref:HAD hydrolase family protein n=1 Tax=Microbacterium sp. J1-1 TaxID=2992441 RepID=UPI0021150EE2|nr:HAD hydrolase family protein [Microbacterium sp. J1-1]UUE22505.1 HAD hydrolase family protein [Microbacterium sp. J1-1]